MIICSSASSLDNGSVVQAHCCLIYLIYVNYHHLRSTSTAFLAPLKETLLYPSEMPPYNDDTDQAYTLQSQRELRRYEDLKDNTQNTEITLAHIRPG